MTESEIKAHAKIMSAARIEFRQFWDLEFVDGMSKSQAVRVEQMAWQFFLHGKGIKK